MDHHHHQPTTQQHRIPTSSPPVPSASSATATAVDHDPDHAHDCYQALSRQSLNALLQQVYRRRPSFRHERRHHPDIGNTKPMDCARSSMATPQHGPAHLRRHRLRHRETLRDLDGHLCAPPTPGPSPPLVAAARTDVISPEPVPAFEELVGRSEVTVDADEEAMDPVSGETMAMYIERDVTISSSSPPSLALQTAAAELSQGISLPHRENLTRLHDGLMPPHPDQNSAATTVKAVSESSQNRCPPLSVYEYTAPLEVDSDPDESDEGFYDDPAFLRPRRLDEEAGGVIDSAKARRRNGNLQYRRSSDILSRSSVTIHRVPRMRRRHKKTESRRRATLPPGGDASTADTVIQHQTTIQHQAQRV